MEGEDKALNIVFYIKNNVIDQFGNYECKYNQYKCNIYVNSTSKITLNEFLEMGLLDYIGIERDYSLSYDLNGKKQLSRLNTIYGLIHSNHNETIFIQILPYNQIWIQEKKLDYNQIGYIEHLIKKSILKVNI